MTEDLFADHDPRRRVAGRLAPVLLFAGGTGGSGATSLAMCAAELSATLGRIPRVVLIDADLRRSDLATVLRASTDLPTSATFAVTGSRERIFLSPGTLNAHRPQHVPDVSFHAVLSPRDPEERAALNAQDMVSLIEASRSVADLVLVNAGPADPRPDSLFSKIVLPVMRAGGWLQLVLDASPVGLTSTRDTLNVVVDQTGITRDRLSVLIGRRGAGVKPEQAAGVLKALSSLAHPLGSIDEDPKIAADLVAGRLPLRHTGLSPALAALLLRVTGRPEFEATAAVKGARAREIVADDGDDDPQPLSQSSKNRLPWRRG